MLILLVPIASAYAESFAIDTNKEIYTLQERVIVVGVIPDDAPSGYAVLVQVMHSGNECAVMNVIPGPDNSFISRPAALDCGPGRYVVNAYYADLKAHSTFTVSNSSRGDSGNRLELRMIKQVVVQAQESVNLRLRGLIEGGFILPQDIAEKYSRGVSEASLALQAVELGNTADAKKYQISAIGNFREVVNALSSEQVAALMKSDERVVAEDNSAVLERLERLKEFYSRLKELAEKNGMDKESEFEATASLLSRSGQMVEAGDISGAEQALEEVNSLLEEIRADLYDDEQKQYNEKTAAPANNATAQQDEDQARRLGDVAVRLEKRLANLQSGNVSEEAAAKIQEAISLISDARIGIEQGDYDSARKMLSDAYKAFAEARKMVESQNDSSNSGSGSREKGDSGEGKEKDEDKGSNRGSSGTSGRSG